LAPREYLTKKEGQRKHSQKIWFRLFAGRMGRAIQSFKEKGYDDEILLDSGLILKGKNGGYYDRFRG